MKCSFITFIRINNHVVHLCELSSLKYELCMTKYQENNDQNKKKNFMGSMNKTNCYTNVSNICKTLTINDPSLPNVYFLWSSAPPSSQNLVLCILHILLIFALVSSCTLECLLVNWLLSKMALSLRWLPQHQIKHFWAIRKKSTIEI